MKRLFATSVSLFFMCVTLFAQKVPVDFDDRTDLMSVVWRLAGAKEYNQCQVTDYSSEVDRFFADFTQHPAVSMARDLYTNGIGYDAVAAYSKHLKITSNCVEFDDELADADDKSLDRWTAQQRRDFVEVLNKFYIDSRFHDWYVSTKDKRDKAIKSFVSVIDDFDNAWFSRFFDVKETSAPRITLSILNGGSNYGLSVRKKDGSLMVNPVIGSAVDDGMGGVAYSKNMLLPIIVHEFCHPYCNNVIDKCWDGIAVNAEKVFALTPVRLSSMSYSTAKIMMYEALVRSCVIIYLVEHYPQVNKANLIDNERDFILVPSLVNVLSNHEKADFEAIATVIVKAVNDFDSNAIQANNAKVEFSMANGAKVEAGQTSFVMTFSKPMIDKISLYEVAGVTFPHFDGAIRDCIHWSADGMKLTLSLNLKPSTHYAFLFKGNGFVTQDGHNAGDDIPFECWTK